jgi:putative ABC transport system substrate-binding protein
MQFDQLKRREFITLLGGTAAWPVAARAQQPERTRRIGVLMTLAEDDPQGQARFGAFLEGLRQFGWRNGDNIRLDVRWTAGNSDEIRRYAAELAALAPDVILASASPSVAALQAATHSLPIVFAQAVDPVGAGFVESLAHPGGNVTGFVPFEYGIAAKWLELLKEIAPAVTRVAVIRDPAIAAGVAQFGAIQSMAPSLKVELVPVTVRDAAEIERGLSSFARGTDSGLIVTASPLATVHRDQIVALAGRHKLPAVYYERFFVTNGGLMSYGPDLVDPYRRAAAYVHRILKGEMPADLPVQFPTKYDLTVNLKTAGTLGLTVPQTLLVAADQVVE